MTKPTLQQALQQHYDRAELPPDRLATLTDMIASGEPAPQPVAILGWPHRLAIAAAVVLMVGLSWLVQSPADRSPVELAEYVCKEILYNHNRDLAMEYQTASFTELARVMDKLEFDPVEPALLAERGYTLVGARYCSVQGCGAVQMRLIDQDGRAFTLYQVRPDPTIDHVATTELAFDDLEVTVWREGGLIMGLAGPAL